MTVALGRFGRSDQRCGPAPLGRRDLFLLQRDEGRHLPAGVAIGQVEQRIVA
ncbi:MAG: hypothetical protein QHC78_06300 [Pigmentiphaga sp.]|uniref:hypothetical protein n=1 Tax=Pigmentiphaga sp. TaxID=1977564 RepID=UPI0029BA9CE9|nr:hypothetical protein [Pigmentiphaga sp.]MDX3905284.1 hypothetical protein [Pigmentiphaga sp.]